MKELNDLLGRVGGEYLPLTLTAGGLAALLGLVVFVVVARARKRPVRPVLLGIGSNFALLLNAEGMWEVATTDLGLPPEFAVLVFAVFEVSLLTAMSLAAEQYRKFGRCGLSLFVVWAIAITSGISVSLSAPTAVERFLRLALPLIVTMLWYVGLTSAKVKKARTRFAFTPERLMVERGWLLPDDEDGDDLAAARRDRRIRLMVRHGHRVAARGLLARHSRRRLTALALGATQDEVDLAVARVRMASGVVERFTPPRSDVEEERSDQVTPPLHSAGVEWIAPERSDGVEAARSADHSAPVTPVECGVAERSAPDFTPVTVDPVTPADDEAERRAEEIVVELLAERMSGVRPKRVTEHAVRTRFGLSSRPAKRIAERVEERVAAASNGHRPAE